MSGLHYPVQNTDVLIGSKSGTTRTSVALTASYDVANKTKAIETGGMSQVVVDILYTTGAAETNNSIEMKVTVGTDATNYYRILNESVSGGTSTLTEREFTFVGASAATAYPISIPLDVFYKYMKFTFKETGVAANFGTVYAEVTLSGR